MAYYIIVQDVIWFNDETFESYTFPTLIGLKELNAEIDDPDSQIVSKEIYDLASKNLGNIYLEGKFYTTPDEVPN